MACTRNCTGTPLCDSLSLSCIQLVHDNGKECAGLPDGYSTIQVDINGDLVICANNGGVCECNTFQSGAGLSVVTVPGDGTIVHNDGQGTIETIDICDLINEAYALSPWVALPLSAGWAVEPGQQAPQYRCLCTGEVQLRGCMTHDDADDDNAVPEDVGILPATSAGNGCRPGSTVRIQAGGHCAEIEIAPDGSLTTNPNITPNTRCLNGTSFYV